MPKAACECNSLTASGANKPHGSDFYRFPVRPRAAGDIPPTTLDAATNRFKILL